MGEIWEVIEEKEEGGKKGIEESRQVGRCVSSR